MDCADMACAACWIAIVTELLSRLHVWMCTQHMQRQADEPDRLRLTTSSLTRVGMNQPVEAHGIARRRKCRQLGEVQLACTLSGLNPSQSRQVIVNIEHEQSGHKLLRVSCASNSRTSFLALRVQLLRFRQCGRKDGQCKIAFNARDEDVEWWVLHFKRNRDMARFQQGLEPESSCTVSV